MNYFFVNYKLEKEGTGERALELTKKLVALHAPSVRTIFVPQIVDLGRLCSLFPQSTFFAPHADAYLHGKGTGFILPESVKSAGATGVVLNHAEHKLSKEVLSKTVQFCRKTGLKIMICADSLEEAREIIPLKPEYIAYEPPELIGGDISVSFAQPAVIQKFSSLILSLNFRIIPITGAGIKTADDVRTARQLGTKGIFVASGIVRAHNPEAAMNELLQGFL